jgi:hypothetical protein
MIARLTECAAANRSNILHCGLILAFTMVFSCANGGAAESQASNEWTQAFLSLSNRLAKANPQMH